MKMERACPESGVRSPEAFAIVEHPRPSGRLSLFETTWLERSYRMDHGVSTTADSGPRAPDEGQSHA